jgi:diaminopropionate ammonia-lyase
MTIPDEPAAECMRLLAAGNSNDPVIVAGESAVAGLAGLLLACQSTQTMSELGLARDSVVLIFGTEADTDPELYRRIVGRAGDSIRANVDADVGVGAGTNCPSKQVYS